MKFKLLAGAAMAAVCAATGASAQVGWYGAIDLGYHWPEGMKLDSTNLAANGIKYTWRFNQEDDYAVFGRLGYQITDHWRAELEGGYRPGNIDSVRGGSNQAVAGLCARDVIRTAAAPTCGSPHGKIESWTLMGNIIYDIGPDWVINPFIGAGVGVHHIDLTTDGQFSNVTGVITAPGGANPAIQTLHIDSSSSMFAWQVLGGASWKATDRLKVDATYRFLSGSDGRYSSQGSAALQPARSKASTGTRQ